MGRKVKGMSKRVQVVLSDKQYEELQKCGKSDSEAVKELMILGMELEKQNRAKHKVVYEEVDLSEDKNFYYLLNYLEAKNVKVFDFFKSIKQKILSGEIEIKNGKIHFRK